MVNPTGGRRGGVVESLQPRALSDRCPPHSEIFFGLGEFLETGDRCGTLSRPQRPAPNGIFRERFWVRLGAVARPPARWERAGG